MMLSNLLRSSAYAWMFCFLFTVFCLSGHLLYKWTFLCVAIIYFLITYLKSRQSDNEPPGIPAVTAARLFYHAYRNRSRLNEITLGFLFGSCLLFPKERMYTITVATKKLLVLYDPKAVEYVLTHNRILRKGFLYDTIKYILKDGLIISVGKKWRDRRRLMTPVFHLKTLAKYFPIYDKHTKFLMLRLSELMKKNEVIDIAPLISSCVLDIASEAMLGKCMDSQKYPNNKYHAAMIRCNVLSGERGLAPWMWNNLIYRKTEDGKTYFKLIDVVHRFVNGAIKELKQYKLEQLQNMDKSTDAHSSEDTGNKSKRHFCSLDHVLNLHIKDQSLTLDGVEEESCTIFVAAHATTMNAINWTLYMIGLHEDVQRNLHEEIDWTVGKDISKTAAAEDLKLLKYLNCVIKEAMRVYPAVPMILRALDEDIEINGYKIKKDVNIIIPIYMIHRNPEIFPNPEVFNPDRFNQSNSKMNYSFSYIPFSAGPRNCIGQTVAVHIIRSVIVSVLRLFKVTAVEQRDKLKLSFDIAMSSENGFPLKFTKRNH